MFERAGDRISDTWNNWRDRNDYDDDQYRGNYGRNNNEDRNMFERTGDRIRNSWNNFSDRDDRDRNDNRYYSGSGRGNNGWNNWDENYGSSRGGDYYDRGHRYNGQNEYRQRDDSSYERRHEDNNARHRMRQEEFAW